MTGRVCGPAITEYERARSSDRAQSSGTKGRRTTTARGVVVVRVNFGAHTRKEGML
ncbi:hypothetical protein BJ994_003130 [Arthrobacter pigmenti]|uniref:Uncharacterized protein n=1 Tax=Arthrobacter pigmenti TaxID=271432 RepID=A0A846RU39_9MICC|nr:hypothetical protein [Arthrobacter pigmenti]NJC24054.1 hypothetical protein [Arthrobacter pigmenti]